MLHVKYRNIKQAKMSKKNTDILGLQKAEWLNFDLRDRTGEKTFTGLKEVKYSTPVQSLQVVQ